MNISLGGPERQFLKEVEQRLNVTSERAYEIICVPYEDETPAEVKDGKIVALNIRAIAHAKSNWAVKKDGAERNVEILSVDEIDISCLTNLEELDFRAYPDKKERTPLYSFSSHPNLKKLTFEFQNLETLDVSGCKQLKELNCPFNQLSSLDISANIELERLNINGNKLLKLDLRNNLKLKDLIVPSNPLGPEDIIFPIDNKIEELYLRDTNFTTIDLEMFPMLKLICLGTTDSRLPSLNLESLPFHKCKSLQEIDLQNVHIGVLDISRNRYIIKLGMWCSKADEVICTEKQLFTIPLLSKKTKNKPSPDQVRVVKALKLHDTAIHYNWDEGIQNLKNILKNDACDLATAMAIYWMGKPKYYLQYSKVSEAPLYDQEDFRFMNKLEADILSGKFTTNLIEFDPKNFNDDDWTQINYDSTLHKREIPEVLTKKVDGSMISCFDETKIIKMSLGK